MPASHLRIRGARQNNLRNLDLDLPLHKLTVVTGLSGSGKSSLAFDTLYAEGQRRYVETFSPYTRQFLERMDKPEVDSIDGIPPAIAIEQSNPVKTSRSTVGTMTEIADYLKLLMARQSRLVLDGREIRPYSAAEIADAVLAVLPKEEALVLFAVKFEQRPTLASALAAFRQQGFVRVLVEGKVLRTDDEVPARTKAPAEMEVIQDRVRIESAQRSRLVEAIEAALARGKGMVRIRAAGAPASPGELRFSNAWMDPWTGESMRQPTPSLFSFNNPVGACPVCRGFGRTIEIDYHRALPDRSLTIAQGVVKPWQSGMSVECQRDLMRHCKNEGIPTDVPFCRLSAGQQRFVLEGEHMPDASLHEIWEAGAWYGVKGYFEWLETKTYKMHVRVFLSRYRAYRKCPVCHGARYQPETLRYVLRGSRGRSLHLGQINGLPLESARDFLGGVSVPEGDEAAKQVLREILSRLGYLIDVGLGYLTLDRATRTLSGGEVERVNLTSCLGNSLVNTLFVLDEPSIGLHPRDTRQLLDVIQRLRDRGNTLVIVEHDEAVMREADHIVDLGPGRGENGGSVVFSGPFRRLLACRASLTADYLSGRKRITPPVRRRQPRPGHALEFAGASSHNIQNLDVTIPLNCFVAVTGVSGSGKSTLVHDIVTTHLLAAKNRIGDEAGEDSMVGSIRGDELVADIIRVDQSPLTKTPRSNPAVYLGIYDAIRKLFGDLDEARAQGLTASDLSFNTGNGRCTRCHGMGFEKIEMQFLADVYLRCGLCEGRRFQPHVLALAYRGKSIADVLNLTAAEALVFFGSGPLTAGQAKLHAAIAKPLGLLEEIGLGYLRLGQPLHQLSGGEAQRVKLLSFIRGFDLGVKRGKTEADSGNGIEEDLPSNDEGKTRLLILDEPTTGLHFEDVRLLLQLFQRLVDQGDSLVVIEHNLDVIQCADWVIDLGPEAGERGGKIVATGSPEKVAEVPGSHTGAALREKLAIRRGALQSVAEAPAAYAAARVRPATKIEIRGARHHNLCDLSLDIDLNRLTVVTGMSGSGKSTLAFDLLFAEGQRRYLDSLNAYARQFVEQLEKPEVDSINGIPPAVAIEQRLTRGGRKSTIATVTEIHQFLRLLYAKLGRAHDPATGEGAIRQSAEEVVARIEAARGKKGELTLLAPLVRGRKGFHTEVAKWAEKKGFAALRVDGKWIEPAKFKALSRYTEHTIDLVLGNIGPGQSPSDRRRLMELALTHGRGTLYTLDNHRRELVYSTHLYCPDSGRSFDELEPRLFSFNSPHGWCPACQGYGTLAGAPRLDPGDYDSELEREMAADLARESGDSARSKDGDDGDSEAEPCPDCGGARLNPVARAVRLTLGMEPEVRLLSSEPALPELLALTIDEAESVFRKVSLAGPAAAIARDILPEIRQRLAFLKEVGLGYLTLDRAATTLSGGESQRIRLAAQLGSNLQGVLYVLDEPTIGLHPRDNQRLLSSLMALRDKGNTLVVVEHDEDTMRAADDIIDLGPGAGTQGGRIVARGSWRELARHTESVTGRLLGQPMSHPIRGTRRPIGPLVPMIRVKGAGAHNLREVDIDLPMGRFIALCGVSGAGKSTLMHDVLKPALAAAGPGASRRSRKNSPEVPWRSAVCDQKVTGVYEVDQSPIGKTSRSTPATYIGLMDDLRALYAQLPLARQRGYEAGRFSFNAGHGRCDKCQGQGAIKVEMNFLPSTWIPCEACDGRRYNEETLAIAYHEKSIADVLEMTIDEAADFFAAVPRLHRPLQLLRDTGLGYLTLGQRSPTLSGGEAQRIKLVAELARSLGINAQKALRTGGYASAHHVYLLEEPTIGLHLADVARLLDVIHQLVDAGHTVIVIEHHLDVLAEADHLIELGPEGGSAGGQMIAQGTPEEVAVAEGSVTGPFLRSVLKPAGGAGRCSRP
jgi:excinuclease ABC subunit A